MEKSLPFITAALLCEKVLQEKDGSLSVIRIADRVSFQAQGLPEGTKPMVGISGLIGIKSGPLVGDIVLRVRVVAPNGKPKVGPTGAEFILEQPFKMLGGDHGQNVVINLGLGIDEEGLYWFEVLIDDTVVTKIPLTVTRLQTESGAV